MVLNHHLKSLLKPQKYKYIKGNDYFIAWSIPNKIFLLMLYYRMIKVNNKVTTSSMRSRLLITSDIYRPLLNKARQSGLTTNELTEALLKKQLNWRWSRSCRRGSYSLDELSY